MVRPLDIPLLAGLLLAAAPAWATGARLEPSRLALGEALTLTLTGEGLDGIDLAPLVRDFHIQGSTLNRSGERETLQVTLYPLHTGRLKLPALNLGKIHSRPGQVTVTAASAETPQVWFRVEADPASPYLRQPTRFTLEACDDGSLQWRRPVLPGSASLRIRPLGEEQRESEQGGFRCTAHRWHWAFIPTRAGDVTLTLPMLEAGKFGRQLRYPAPAAHLSVKPVPDWLPLPVPIGAPRVDSEPLPATWPVDRPLAWRFRLTGGLSVDGVKALLAPQIHGPSPAGAYAPTVENLPGDPLSPQTHLAITLYPLPRARGPLVLPDLTLPWFDPTSGRLEYANLPGGTVKVVDPARETALRWLAGLLGIALGAAALTAVARQAVLMSARRRRLAAIAGSDSLADLLRNVRLFSPDTHPTFPATLGIWAKHLTAQGRCPGLKQLVVELERAAFGQGTHDLDVLRDQAVKVLNCCRRRRPWWIWLAGRRWQHRPTGNAR